jgi:hypothetical protein
MSHFSGKKVRLMGGEIGNFFNFDDRGLLLLLQVIWAFISCELAHKILKIAVR